MSRPAKVPNPVVGREAAHVRADRGNHPGGIAPGHERAVGPGLVETPQHQRIGEVEAERKDLDQHQARANGRAVDQALASGAEAGAECLLFAYVDDAHERRIGAALAERDPALAVSLSSDVQPEFREYERFSTTVLNAYLQPVVGRYLAFLGDRIADGVPGATVASTSRAARSPGSTVTG